MNLTNATLAHIETGDGPVPVPTIIDWTPSEPAVVSFDFKQENGVTWAVSRDLILDALRTNSEHGDLGVMASATDLHFMLVLHNHFTGGFASVRMPRSAVAWIVDRSVEMIAPGSQAEVDAIVASVEAELALGFGDAA